MKSILSSTFSRRLLSFPSAKNAVSTTSLGRDACRGQSATTNTGTTTGGGRPGIPVEQLNLKTGKVMNTLPSISSAARAVGAQQRGIHDVAGGHRSNAANYVWREIGSDVQPSPVIRVSVKIRVNVPVEKVCPVTGKLLQTFQSITEAERIVGCSGIDEVIQGHAKTAGGFFWREEGSNVKPRGLFTVPIEMVCPETGKTLLVFESIVEAERVVRCSGISAVILGRRPTAGGYFWRLKGSVVKPRQLQVLNIEMIYPKIVELLDFDRGIDLKKGNRKETKPGCCYLLLSQNSKPYIGVTAYPLRRLAQHNGEKKGGAKQTENGGEWTYGVAISGFTTRSMSTKFESAWQNLSKGLRRNNNVHDQVIILKVLLAAFPELYEGASLTIYFFDEDTRATFEKSSILASLHMVKKNVPSHTICSISLKDFVKKSF